MPNLAKNSESGLRIFQADPSSIIELEEHSELGGQWMQE